MVKSLPPSTSGSAKDGTSDGPPAGEKPKAEARSGRKRGQGGHDIPSSQGGQASWGSAAESMELGNTGGQKQQAGEQKVKLHKEKSARLLKLMVKALLRNI